MAGKKTKAAGKVIGAVKHRDKRKNIPTEELRDFVKEDEQKPKNVEFPGLLYARDPSLDPQLVWKGKDEQDRQPLTVPSVPIYIQEKVHPQAIIEDLRAEARKAQKEEQLSLFSDFNGIKFEDLIEFYQHEANWSNRMILGDSLLVMTSLAEKERLKGQVQMIYIDPPYGIKFNSNWQVSTRKRDVKDGKAEDLTRQPEQVRAFRDTWALGIHSYLAYLRDRLTVARELLTESGSVFVQIGEENVHLVRSLLDEVFGSENFCSSIIYVTTSTQGSELLPIVNDHILWYAKDKTGVKYRPLFDEKALGQQGSSGYNFIEDENGSVQRLSSQELTGNVEIPQTSRIFSAGDLTSSHYSLSEPIHYNGTKYSAGGRYWSTSTMGMYRVIKSGRMLVMGNSLRFKRYIDDFGVYPRSNIWTDTGVAGFTSTRKIYVVQTNEKVIERCLLMTTDPGDLVFDPTCGSGTTAYLAEQWGRRWITCDTSRVSLALARTRLMGGRFPYYILSDTQEGIQKEAEITGKIPPQYRTDGDIRKGFVCKRVPHITLKGIANNEEIDEIHARYQPELDELLKRINKTCKQKWKEWEIPHPSDGGRRSVGAADATARVPPQAEKLVAEFWDLRRKRQAEIDASIQKNADQEILVDQPYEDSKRIRVTGPFTVESLSPHRTISVEKKQIGRASCRERVYSGV